MPFRLKYEWLWELLILISVPVALWACAVYHLASSALITLLVCIAALIIFFLGYEASRPALGQMLPTVVLGTLAALGRLLFAAFPSFKPVSAICLIAGALFGRRSGFMVGALGALISNFFLGQGPWTPWQMYAWGLIGYLAGLLAQKDLFRHQWVLYGYGFASAFLFGFLLDCWTLVAFVQPITLAAVITVFGGSFLFNLTHGVATVVFLLILYGPWRKKLQRIIKKYQLIETS